MWSKELEIVYYKIQQLPFSSSALISFVVWLKFEHSFCMAVCCIIDLESYIEGTILNLIILATFGQNKSGCSICNFETFLLKICGNVVLSRNSVEIVLICRRSFLLCHRIHCTEVWSHDQRWFLTAYCCVFLWVVNAERCALVDDQNRLMVDARRMLEDEVAWLVNFVPSENGGDIRLTDNTLLAGHLHLIQTLLTCEHVDKVDAGQCFLRLRCSKRLAIKSCFVS